MSEYIEKVLCPTATERDKLRELCQIVFGNDHGRRLLGKLIQARHPMSPRFNLANPEPIPAAFRDGQADIGIGNTFVQSGAACNLSVRWSSGGSTTIKGGWDDNGVSDTSFARYAVLAGDTNGNYGNWSPPPGKHTIVATPFSKPRAGGDKGQPFSVSFTVVGEAKRVSVPIEYPTLEDESVFETMVIPSNSPKITGFSKAALLILRSEHLRYLLLCSGNTIVCHAPESKDFGSKKNQ